MNKPGLSGHIIEVYYAYRVRDALKSRVQDSQFQAWYHRRRIPSYQVKIKVDIGRYWRKSLTITNTFPKAVGVE
eukprot:5226294-Pleurochrysis_carterae.AAC.1